MKIKSFDVLGNTAIINFHNKLRKKEKIKFAERLMAKNNRITSVFEKSGKIKGRLRKPLLKYVAGKNTEEVLYRENGCVFRFNISSTYFSPRLSNERKEIASLIKENKIVFVMFAGVAPFSIVIAKNSNCRKVYSNEINREANKYTKLNVELNNLKGKVEIIPGDIRKISRELHSRGIKFDVIVMPRPRLKSSFLEQAFMLSKKGTRVYYYDFAKNFSKKNFGATKFKTASSHRSRGKNLVGCKMGGIAEVVEKIKNESKKYKKKIKILKLKKAGEIAPFKIRLRVDFKVM